MWSKKICCCCCCFFFFKDKRHVSERSKHLSENVLILNLHWQCPSCERSCQGCIRRTHRTPPPAPTPGQGWGKGMWMKISSLGWSIICVLKKKNPGLVLMIRGKEETHECPSKSVRESTHFEKLVEWRKAFTSTAELARNKIVGEGYFPSKIDSSCQNFPVRSTHTVWCGTWNIVIEKVKF